MHKKRMIYAKKIKNLYLKTVFSISFKFILRLTVVSHVAKENCLGDAYQESFTCIPVVKTEQQNSLFYALIISL